MNHMIGISLLEALQELGFKNTTNDKIIKVKKDIYIIYLF